MPILNPVARLWAALRGFAWSACSAEFRWMDSATLADMKLPFEMANGVRREQVLCRPFAVRAMQD
jgi:hypothetical protein